MGMEQRYVIRRPPKRVVKILSSNAVIRVDLSSGKWHIVVADDHDYKRLFDISERTERDYFDLPYPFYVVQRICPKCSAMNTIRVTHRPGYPEGDSGLWCCDKCDHTLAKVDAVRGRVSVRRREVGTISVSIADVLATIGALEREDEQCENEANHAGVPYERFSFIPPVGETFPVFDDVPF